MTTEGVWRWNVDDVWQSFSSMYQEMSFANEATNNIARYHHLSACLLFGGCAIESFLNANIRIHLKQSEEPENKILRRLRYTALREKIESWPFEICEVTIYKGDLEVLLEFLDLRNEVTHRKRIDHSLYKELDEATPVKFVEAIQKAFVQLYHGQGTSFPYWLLGWNFVGFNRDQTHPLLINNQQFKHTLNHMGFKVPAWECHSADAWEEENMKGIEAFLRLKRDYYQKAPNIEPKNKEFPMAPRLCKRWWDKKLILGAG
jgi:hypothetical protein